MLKEFKEFVTKGNVMDLAIGVVMGAAFQSIVNSLVKDIIMPFVSMFTGKVDFSDLKVMIGSTSINYGNFITQIVNFLIIAFSIFIVVKYINKLNRLKDLGENIVSKVDKDGKLSKYKKDAEENAKEEIEPETKVCPHCLSEIKYKATKCPYCTSNLEEVENVSE
ncbi:MAG: large conductance mechanosensitive channel protein MscL [Clostridia bacterium]|nr:large conductance mechanosensitive channel protein MscL [Clostridia bacterium]